MDLCGRADSVCGRGEPGVSCFENPRASLFGAEDHPAAQHQSRLQALSRLLGRPPGGHCGRRGLCDAP